MRLAEHLTRGTSPVRRGAHAAPRSRPAYCSAVTVCARPKPAT
jgi:hypothetical protein